MKQRNGYIDAIKFIFAIIIMIFHLGIGIFPGGRIAVEGFFMISGYFMMKNIERNRFPNDRLGVSTVRFIFNKYKALFPFLLPSVFVSYALYCIRLDRTLLTSIIRAPLLLFEIFPLREAGYKGTYVIGISWYLAAMFLALAILYPLCKRYKSTFTLAVCPLLSVLIYGTLSHFYGNIAIGTTYIEGTVISAGLLRGLAGCALGCVLYEVCERLTKKAVTNLGRAIFTVLEIVGFTYLFYCIQKFPKSEFDFILVFLIFGLLTIGISNLSVSSLIFTSKWTRPLGTASLLIVLNHYKINSYLLRVLGNGYAKTEKIWIFFGAVLITCIAVWSCAELIKLIEKKLKKINIWKE